MNTVQLIIDILQSVALIILGRAVANLSDTVIKVLESKK